tara:strand:+ start:387 stop:1148 length:762 start_codon:yes stop_codon:yes gene_type:complete
MKALLRNCQHGGDVFITVQFNSSGIPKNIYKSSSTLNGIQSLSNEVEGFKWYSSLNKKSMLATSVATSTEFYCKLRSNYIEGTKLFYYDGLSKNLKYIYLVISHYCKVWGFSAPNKELHNIHGDFSIDNVIFCDSLPIIIDWEHFNQSVAPIGFDALNLIFEQLWFDKKKLHSDTLFETVKMILLLKSKKCLSPLFLENPLNKTINFILNNPSIWKGQAMKLPITKFSAKEIKKIDKIITKMIISEQIIYEKN